MSRKSKRDYLQAVYAHYHKASRQEKSRILDEFSQACGYNRKYAIWLLNQPLPKSSPRRKPQKRPKAYSEQAIMVLATIWEASGYLCSQNLKEALPLWLPWTRDRFQLSPELEGQLLSISTRQMDRRLAPYKQKVKRKIYGTTKPGTLLSAGQPEKQDAPRKSSASTLLLTLEGVDFRQEPRTPLHAPADPKGNSEQGLRGGRLRLGFPMTQRIIVRLDFQMA